MLRKKFAQELRIAQRQQCQIALLFLDLDHFKDINDTLGHDQGDELLKQVARRLEDNTRRTDIVARLGGNEFTVVMGRIKNNRSVNRVADHILLALSKPFQLETEVVWLSASIGITLYPDNGADLATLSKNSDQAMYVAKNAGRNRYQYFEPVMQETAHQRMILINSLREAINQEELELY
jgi:diguanylate cyclase (GGDEF)-like protein